MELKYVKQRMIDKNIGYLRLTQFGENVYPDVKALEELQKSGMKGLIFDLRSNHRSLRSIYKNCFNVFKRGKSSKCKIKDGNEQVSNREGKYYGDFPLVVLINGGSASASEIVI